MSDLLKTPGRRRMARRAGLLGAVIGVAAAGVAAGVTAERLLLRRIRSVPDDPYEDERFGQLPFDESLTVTGPDGLDLYVEVVEPTDGVELDPGFDFVTDSPEPTLVFVHGFCLDMGTFHFQRAALTRLGDYRMVFYDQPGHGRSAKLADGEYTLDSLGESLKAVLDATVPTGPVVLIGHSMGGMTVMALAELYPELFLDRVRGVVFMSTSGGKLDEVSQGIPDFLARFGPLLPVVISSGRLTSGVIDSVRRASTDLAWLLTRRYGFGDGKPSPHVVSYVEHMNSTTGTEVVVRYLRALYTHARYPALEVLKRTRVLVLCGEKDQLTPLAHSEEIARLVPDAELVVVPDAGHVVMLEFPDVVNAALLDFLARVE
ncbi:MAG TPA: alpha/beta hydrolase [Rugosimonospora sp.]|nr:alpha/beta hydrolase [Rugosimonospora sp.]